MYVINNGVVALVTPIDKEDTEYGEQDSYCSGSFVRSNTVLTAAHCIVDDNTLNVRVATYQDYLKTNGTYEGRKWHWFDVKYVDKVRDLALLQLSYGEQLPVYKIFTVASSAPVVGENVLLIGHPIGLGWTVSFGVVSTDNRHGWDHIRYPEGVYVPIWIQASAQSWYGTSGGPLLNYDNQLAGVLVQGVEEYLSMSIHTEVIHDFLEKNL
jgi:S1-C subfamily serine protease